MAYELFLKGIKLSEDCIFVTLTTDNGVDGDISDSLDKLLQELSDNGGYEYAYVVTDEGNGVVHLLIRDCCLPTNWFFNLWSKLHLSYVVYKSRVSQEIAVDLAVYLATQENILDINCSKEWI